MKIIQLIMAIIGQAILSKTTLVMIVISQWAVLIWVVVYDAPQIQVAIALLLSISATFKACDVITE